MFRTAVLAFALALCWVVSAKADERLINVSTRGQVLTDAGVLIGGFVITGEEDKTVLIRARGPSLVPFGVDTALSDPFVTLNLLDNTTIATNDDWASDPRANEIPENLALTE